MERVERWLWRMQWKLYGFFRLEYEGWKYYPNNKVARKHYKIWRRQVKRVDDLTPQEQDEWYEEERLKWKDYYEDLL